MKFSIRDLLWLTVVAAVALAWWVDRGHLQQRYAKEVERAGIEKMQAEALVAKLQVELAVQQIKAAATEATNARVEENSLPNSSAPIPKLPKE